MKFTFVQNQLKMNIKDYPIVIDLPVQWGEMDAFGHINNVVYFRYLESGRISYFDELDFRMQATSVAPILAEITCRFIQPLFFPDQLQVGSRIVSMGNSSMVMEHGIFSKKLGLVATGKGVIVCFDYEKKLKTRIPDRIRKTVFKLEGKEF